jgi:hypothetical protein
MNSLTVVKHLKLFKYILLSLSSGLITLMMNQFCFQDERSFLRRHCTQGAMDRQNPHFQKRRPGLAQDPVHARLIRWGA